MKKYIFKEKKIDYLILLVLSLIAYHIIYGLSTVIPTNINWLMSAYHDWGQHYLGWAYYKEADWTLPLGKMNNFYYPVGTNVGFTDSIPLLAFFFKIFAFLLPEDFQYFGIWLLSCLFFNGLYTYKILKLFKVNIIFIYVSVILIVTNPVIVFRGMHPALCAHWLILGSFYYYLIPTTKENVISNYKKQGLLFFLSATINPYLATMIMGFNIALAVKNYYYEKNITIKQAILMPILSLISGILFWVLFGLIDFENSTNLDVGNIYGTIYSFNLNSFFNSYGFYSKYIPQIGMLNDSQHEGFAYLGLGMIFLVSASSIVALYFIISKKINKSHRYLIPLFMVCALMLIFAITNTVTLGTEIILKYPTLGLIEKLGNIFRATGRFAWPFYYFLIIFSLIIFNKINIKATFKTLILLILMSIQIYDIENLLTSRDLKNGAYNSKLDEEKWKLVIDNFDEVFVYPPYSNNLVYNMDYQDLMYVSLKSKKPISIGYVARENVIEANDFKDTLFHRIKAGEIDEKQLYLTNKENLNNFDVLFYKDKVNIKKLDGFFLIYSKNKKIRTEYIESLENKKSADSIKNHYKNLSKPNLKTFNGSFISKDNIQLNLEFFKNNEDVIQASGWAFIKGSLENSKDSIFISLFNKTNNYLFKTNPVIRGDISEVYKAKLENSGFNTTFFADKLPRSNYQVAIVIKNNEGKYHFIKTDKIVEIGNKKYKEPMINNISYKTIDIIYNLEGIKKQNGIVMLNGWAAINNQNSTGKTIKIVLINNKLRYELETDMVIRKDVSAGNKNKHNYDFSGFELKFKEKDIPRGLYKVGVVIKDEKTGIGYFSSLDKNLRI